MREISDEKISDIECRLYLSINKGLWQKLHPHEAQFLVWHGKNGTDETWIIYLGSRHFISLSFIRTETKIEHDENW